jgi:hypothetical protein
MADNDPVFDIPSRDFSKDPASLGEKVLATAKMAAEPYAETIRNAYRAATGAKPQDHDFAFGKPRTD